MAHSYIATVYTRPGCMKCRATNRILTQMGVPVQMVPLDDHPEKIELMREKGWQSLPLVEVDGPEGRQSWADLNINNLDALRYLVEQEEAA